LPSLAVRAFSVSAFLFLHLFFCIPVSETDDSSEWPFLPDARLADNLKPLQSHDVGIPVPMQVERRP